MEIIPLTGAGGRAPRADRGGCAPAGVVPPARRPRPVRPRRRGASSSAAAPGCRPGRRCSRCAPARRCYRSAAWFTAGRLAAPGSTPSRSRSPGRRRRVPAPPSARRRASPRASPQHPQDWHMLQRLWTADLPGPSPAAGERRGQCRCGSGSSARTRFDVPGGVQNHVHGPRRGADRARARGERARPGRRRTRRLPPYVVPAGRAVPVPYNGSVARLAFGPVSAARVRRWLRRPSSTCCTCTSRSRSSLSMLAVLLRARAGGGHLPHRDDPLPGADAPLSGLLQPSWRRSPPGSRSASWPARCRSSTSAADAVEIPNGVAVAQFATRRAAARAGPRAGGHGRLPRPVHRAAQGLPGAARTRFAALAADRPGLRLLVAGPGRRRRPAPRGRPELRDRVDVPGPGRRSGQGRGCCAASTCTCAPNTGGESFGMILTEAMAAGTAVVASDLDAFRAGARRRPGRRAVPDRRRGRAGRARSAELLDDPARRAELAAARAGVVAPSTTGRWSPRGCCEVYATAIEADRRTGDRASSADRPDLDADAAAWPLVVVVWRRRRGACCVSAYLTWTACTAVDAARAGLRAALRPAGGRGRCAVAGRAGRPRRRSARRARSAVARRPRPPPDRRSRPDAGGRGERPDPAAGAAVRPVDAAADALLGRAGRRRAARWCWPGRCTPTWSATRWRCGAAGWCGCCGWPARHRCPAYFDIDDAAPDAGTSRGRRPIASTAGTRAGQPDVAIGCGSRRSVERGAPCRRPRSRPPSHRRPPPAPPASSAAWPRCSRAA